MNSKLTFRSLTEKDYEILCDWWKWWKFNPLAKEALPENGTGGFMVEYGNTNVCAGFIYKTNSNICLIEWVISNYNVKDKIVRKEAIKLLINALTSEGRRLGFKVAFTWLINENLKTKMEDCGFVKTSQPIEMIKKL